MGIEIGKMISKLRTEKGLNQREFASILGVSNGTIGMWETGKRQPDLSTVSKIADFFHVSVDYLFGNECFNTALGYSGEDEAAITFSQKLANQMDYNGTKAFDLADALGIDEKTVLNWLLGTDNSYENYYQKLSDYFNVQNRYWTSPNAISPGIEPNMEEYLLILLYREYQEKGSLNELYGPLEHYFPGIKVIQDSYSEKLLSAFENLSEDNKDIIIGEVKKCLKEQRFEDSVAAESVIKKQAK